jgi:peptidoglycan/LPS O-acetylase OafA/YrhL
LRAIAAASVVVHHVWSHGAPGAEPVDLAFLTKFPDLLRLGVGLFFVLSGLLLYRPYAAAVIRFEPLPPTQKYFWSRALRILPAYWVVLLAVAVFLTPALIRAPHQFLANMLLLQNYVPEFIPTENGGLGLLVAWSLAVEVVFYVSLPLLGMLALRLARGRHARPVRAAFVPVALLAVIGLAAKPIPHVLEGDTREIWRFSFPLFADLFAMGMTLAVMRVLWEDGRLHLPRWWRYVAVGLFVVMPLVGAKVWYGRPVAIGELYSLAAVGFAALIALLVLGDGRSLLVRVLESRLLLSAGVASYSVFLVHNPILRALREAGYTVEGSVGFIQNLLVVSTVTALATAALYLVVERPVLRRKELRRLPSPAP